MSSIFHITLPRSRGRLARVAAGLRREPLPTEPIELWPAYDEPVAFVVPRVNDEVDLLAYADDTGGASATWEPGSVGLCGDPVTPERPCCGGACRNDEGKASVDGLLAVVVLGVVTVLFVTVGLVMFRVAAWGWSG